MDYTVSDIAELLEEAEIDVSKIRKVGKVWGEYVAGSWQGGMCFRSETGDHYRVHRSGEEVSLDESSDGTLPPLSSDYEERPTDVVDWLRAGGHFEDAYEY